MYYDARQIANWFVARFRQDKRELTVMKLLKLVYISHGWYLGHTGEPLIAGTIEAWKFGPVILEIYFGFEDQALDITEKYSGPDLKEKELDKFAQGLLNDVYNKYSRLGSFKLSAMTHEPGGPWDVASRIGGHFALISDELIYAYYAERVRKMKEERRVQAEAG